MAWLLLTFDNMVMHASNYHILYVLWQLRDRVALSILPRQSVEWETISPLHEKIEFCDK